MRVALAAACVLGLGAWDIYPSGAAAASEPTEGRLVIRHKQETVDLPLEHTDVHIRIDGYLAQAAVTQTFHNPYKDPIEAVYLFPLPQNAAVSDMEIAVGERVIRGAIHRRGQAERIYKKARKQGRVAALLTQERPNLFTQSVANIAPGERIRVTLRYAQPLTYEAGDYELVFPMVAGPRYVPGGNGDPVIQPAVLPPGLRSSHDISLRVDLDAGVPVHRIESPSHRIDVAGDVTAGAASPRAEIRIAAGDTIPNKDFILRYHVAGQAPEFAVIAHRDRGPGSFVFLAQPPEDTGPAGHREVIFVLDTSSSMNGAPLHKAKELIRRVLGGLRPDDTYQIVRFADTAGALGSLPIAKKPDNIKYTLDWLEGLDARGGTEMVAGIDAALAVPHDPARLRIVVFVTDGFIGNEDAILANVAARLGESRLFSFGVGSAVNRYLLEEMAVMGRGDVQIVRPDEDTDAAVARFYRRIDRPVLTDIEIDWNGLAVTDLVPARVPDLFSGKPLVLSGHYDRGSAATVTVRGKRAGRPVSFAVPVLLPDQAPERPAVAAVWARFRIAELSRIMLRPGGADHKEEITLLALEHKLMSPYTAFVAVDQSQIPDKDRKPGDPVRVTVPVEVPESVRGIASGGGYGYGTIGYGSGAGYGVAYGTYGTIGHGGGGSAASVGYGGMLKASGRAASVPQVRIGAATTTGDLDKNIIRRYVRRQLPRIRYCYEKRLVKQPTFAGVATARFRITSSGAVLDVQVAGMDDQLHACVAEVIKAIEFPKVPGNEKAIIDVTYPFTFKPASEPGEDQ